MTSKPQHYAAFDAPDLEPVLVTERTTHGWRGLTADGEVLNVTAKVNGAPAAIPESLAIMRAGEIIGYRRVPQTTSDGAIDQYEQHRKDSAIALRANDFEQALTECEAAIKLAPTWAMKYNQAIVLLHMRHWDEGLKIFAECELASEPFMRPACRAMLQAGLTPWNGEDLAGKRLLLVHDHGYGDGILMLRFVPQLRAMGAEVVLQMPPELDRLAAQVAPVMHEWPIDADYFCPLFMVLLHRLGMTPDQIPTAPYLRVDDALQGKWRERIGTSKRKRIGIAWLVGHDHVGDYPREVPLGLCCKKLGNEGDLFSVQPQGVAEADLLGVEHFQFEDFADCAALMSLMDEIVTVDTAAVHLAGAIGHPNISLLLSHWASWRWHSRLYDNIRFCQQDADGDWESAFAKRVGAFAKAGGDPPAR